MTESEATRFAQEWVAAWNSRDLERILSHYADDVELTSPLVPKVLGGDQLSVRGKCKSSGRTSAADWTHIPT